MEIGSTLLHYSVESCLGQGGMGTVYRARDTRLNRTVAIKVLEIGDREATEHLLHEARAASALNHPNSVTIHSVEQFGDTAFIVMEHVDGRRLDTMIPANGLAIDEALRIAIDVADAIADAHEQGIVHRDLKPANVMLTSGGRVKVLDFGIARRSARPDEVTRASTLGSTMSAPGVVVGTAGYMSPEQIEGVAAGPPSDVFALGALLYHLLSGRLPFAGDSMWAVMEATMRREPPALPSIRPEIPGALAAIVSRALAKDPAARYPSAREMRDALAALRSGRTTAPSPARPRYSRTVIAAAVAAALAIAATLAWFRVRDSRLQWARQVAIPEISRLATAGDPIGSLRLAQRAREAAPNDPQVIAAWNGVTRPIPITTDPTGAEVAIRSLSGKDEGWIVLGQTPATANVPMGQYRWRFSKNGYETREIAGNPFPSSIPLVPAGTGPSRMVLIPSGELEIERQQSSVQLPAFWLDAFEVTNREFKTFVDAGGYQKREYWTQPFVKDGRTLSWEEAMAQFRDGTGRPAPSTWELGTYADGQGEWPVSGVSWYEAAAYAAFAKKTLPTVYHWKLGAGVNGPYSDVLQFSNFGGSGAVRVGTAGSLGPYGTNDMAGNVKEWVWNESSDGKRFVLGGGWFEARHQFHDEDARTPFEREPGFGFRCMEPRDPIENTLQATLSAPIATLTRDVAALRPVGDDVFNAYRALYEYDKPPLDARVEERDEAGAHWIMERVTVTAAYGDERLPMMLFLPRASKPPFQTVVYFPGSDAVRTQSSRGPYMQWLEFLLRSGRAVAFPVYQQTYERRREQTGANFLRQVGLQRGQDVRRAVDYLESRQDIDRTRLALYGLSLGAQLAPVYLAIEPRFRTGVLLSGGFETWTIPAETDPVNFAPHVKQPVLMVNGREDFDLPYETAQVPLFNMLGTAPAEKRHAVLEGGHLPPRPQAVFKEILDWLDRYLGPVQQ